MNEDVDSSLYVRVVGPLFFFSTAVVSIYWFFTSAAVLVGGIANLSSPIVFDKGSMYLLGVSIAVLSMFLGVIYHSFYLRKVPEKFESTLVKSIVVGILIMFALPQAVHFYVSYFVDKNNYLRCSEVEYRWFLHQKYVYTESEAACLKLVNDKA